LGAARTAWTETMLAWEGAGAIAFGPLLARRSVFRIDFWPARSNLIEKALNDPPTTLKGLELVGGPAKGIAAIEWLLWTPSEAPEILVDKKRCAYASLLAVDVAEEARLLNASFVAFAASGLPESAANDAFAGLLNLAVGGLEQLGVRKIEKPGETGNGKNFPRFFSGQTAAAWNAQWLSIRNFLIGDGGERNDNLDSVLRAQGLVSAAGHMREASDRVSKTLKATEQATQASARQAAKDIVILRKVMVEEVAAGLKIPVQFGENDGD
jgi:predicted lipoprotein